MALSVSLVAAADAIGDAATGLVEEFSVVKFSADTVPLDPSIKSPMTWLAAALPS
jgi:hypothetical protein